MAQTLTCNCLPSPPPNHPPSLAYFGIKRFLRQGLHINMTSPLFPFTEVDKHFETLSKSNAELPQNPTPAWLKGLPPM